MQMNGEHMNNTKEREGEQLVYRAVRGRHTYEQIHNKVLEIVFDKKPKPFPRNKATADWVDQTIEPQNWQTLANTT